MQLQAQEPQNGEIDKTKMSASFFFLSLGLLITLITFVVSFLNLVFETLNKRFPDVLNSVYEYGYSSYQYESIRMSLATLIIFFPILVTIIYFWNKVSSKSLTKLDEVVRKWLIYILLFLSGLVAAIDLVVLVHYFISGEITIRFILKVFAVLVVALYVGVYFIFKLKGKEKIFGFDLNIWTIIKSSILVLAMIIWSFTVIGTPWTQRQLRLDDKRVQDLQNIQYQIINYWQTKEKLPEKITDLSNPMTGYSLPIDPEFEKGKIYEYGIKGALTFELCADFGAPMPKGWQEYKGYGGAIPIMEGDVAMSYPAYPLPRGINESWSHEIGRTCFERTIDKDLYPPYPKPEKI